MKQRNNWRRAVLCMLILVMMLCPLEVQAASQKTKAIKAYKSMLSKKTMRWGNDTYYTKVPAGRYSFTLAYIDKDSVPELVVTTDYVTHAAGSMVIYTYRNGKVQVLTDGSNDSGFYADNSRFSYYKKKSVFVSCYGTGGVTDHYFKMNKNKASKKLIADNSLMWGKSWYQCSGDTNKKISKSSFNSNLKKLVGSTKKTTVKFHKNTSANRKKYLK